MRRSRFVTCWRLSLERADQQLSSSFGYFTLFSELRDRFVFETSRVASGCGACCVTQSQLWREVSGLSGAVSATHLHLVQPHLMRPKTPDHLLFALVVVWLGTPGSTPGEMTGYASVPRKEIPL